MGINKYKTDLGLFSIITDDVAYNYAAAQSTSSVQVVSTSGLTAAGIELKNILNTDNISVTLYATFGYTVGSILNNFLLLFPNTETITPTQNTPMTEYQIGTTTKSVRAEIQYYNTGVNVNSNLYEANTYNLYFSNVYGNLKRYNNSDNYLGQVEVKIYIFNSNFTAGTTLRFSSSSRNTVSVNRSDITTSLYPISKYKSFFSDIEPYTPTTDPYSGAGDSDTGGGGGTFDGSSDPVVVPSLPSVGATDTGFISLFVPSQSQLKQVADYLWSPLLDISTFKKIFENPMDCILGLSVVPLAVPTSGSAQITVGNVELSGISLPLASQQYVEIDCGSISFTDKFFGSYLDQDPYTKMSLFVPYSGVHSIKADDVMGKTVNLKYHIDILTGSLVAFLTCGNSVLYEFNGACASNIPVNSMNYASTIENAIRIAVNIGTTVATAGASAPLSGAAGAAAGSAARTFGTAVNMAGSTAEGILSLKPNIDRAGSLGGTTGLMGNQTPYFIITRPRLCKPANQNKIKGYPSFINTTVGDLVGEGYTEFDSIILNNLYLTDAEKEELKQILESGVYL